LETLDKGFKISKIKIMKKHICHPTPKSERNEKIFKHYQVGHSHRAIARIFHISHARVGQIIRAKLATLDKGFKKSKIKERSANY